MAQLSKETKIISRVKLMLGGSILKIEISDEDIRQLIDIALDTIRPYLTDYKYITVPYHHYIDLSEYNVSEVLRVMPGSNITSQYGQGDEYNFDFTQWRMVDQMNLISRVDVVANSVTPDIDISFDYDAETHILLVTPGITTFDLTLECVPEVYSIEDIRDQTALKWIYLYTLALAKEVVGRIRSKAKSTNLPIELDGDTLLNEASTEKSVLENSLIADATGPVAILR